MSTEVFAKRSATPPVWRRAATRPPRSKLFGNAFACLIPMLMFIEVKLVGRLFLSEILLLCMLPFLLIARGQLLLAPLPKKLILLGLAWLLSQILTDAIRGTPFEDWSRGWSKIIFLLLDFSAIYLYLNGKEKRFFLFAAGIALGQILAYFLNPNIYAEGLPWKFGYGTAITLLAVLASQIRAIEGRKFSSSAIILGVGVLNFYMGFRSLGLICLLAGGFVAVKQSNRFSLKKMKRSKVAMLILLSGVAIYGITALYDYGATEGWLGMEARDKYLMQSSGDMGILLGGRTESLASSQAILDSPLIGHGSWAKDQRYVDLMQNKLEQLGYEVIGVRESDQIPSHSYLLGSWVEAGILGALLWIWILRLVYRFFRAAYLSPVRPAPWVIFSAFLLSWNVLFSPFGADHRLLAAYQIALIMLALRATGEQSKGQLIRKAS